MLCKDNKKEGHLQISKSFKFLSFRCLARFGAVWQANAPIYGKNFNISGVKIFSRVRQDLAVSDIFAIFISSFHAQSASKVRPHTRKLMYRGPTGL